MYVRGCGSTLQPFIALQNWTMLLTVVIPIYNTAAPLRRCLLSLHAGATDHDVQLLVVDDGSTPQQAAAIREVVKDMGEKSVVLIPTAHRGAAAARNVGIEHADGRYLWFVDADDTVDAVHFRALLQVLESLPPDVQMFHTGNYHILSRPNRMPSLAAPQPGASGSATLATVLLPQSGCLDMFTWIVATEWLRNNPALRFPEEHALLEDSMLVLRMLDSEARMMENSTLSPYLHHVYGDSSTSGAWSPARCADRMNDVTAFFTAFRTFVLQHPSVPCMHSLYDRYRYVYLRVMAVKGCPAALLDRLRGQMLDDEALPYTPHGFRQRMLYCRTTHHALAWLCRQLRNTSPSC